ncbi:MAG: phosphoribosylanthranilate isomerase [Actinobacteria bacterium]|nr:phosphoribosylanthranilate isomerase [Actinomycetota bacterium]
MPLVKVCGLTRAEDVELAWILGAWAVGFVFAPSPRRVTPATTRALVERAVAALATGGRRRPERSHVAAGAPAGSAGAGAATENSIAGIPGRERPYLVGVFGDVPAGEIAESVAEAGLDMVQLHGVKGPAGGDVREALREMMDHHRRLPLIIRAVPVDPSETNARSLRARVAEMRTGTDAVLLDTRGSDGFGGTGRAFAWSLARQVDDGLPLLIAGGITPDNVRTALRESGAWGVDVSSGVERAPGTKDPVLLRRLFAALPTNNRHIRQEGLDR